MNILRKSDLEQGGFSGIKEHRLVMDEQVFKGRANPGVSQGLGHFVYLADAQFNPMGETGLHDHKEIDVISVMVDGQVTHEGSLKHGQSLLAGQVQAQRAGGEGFSHNEINPDQAKNRMIQLWVLPEQAGQCADYKLYSLPSDGLTRIYGGADNLGATFSSNTLIDVGYLKAGKSVNLDQRFVMYLAQGSGLVDGEVVSDGDLISGDSLVFETNSQVMVIIITLLN
ncbi:MAG: pirin family protein [Gammaproteobacteria bacterium]|nr:pirin family protein [Gammaproteobacteria bacterium]